MTLSQSDSCVDLHRIHLISPESFFLFHIGIFSTIRHEEFPHRLLPTLARYGFVEAGIILREIEQSGALDEVFKVFLSGGGVGDAIVALETCIETNPLIYVELRKSLRQQQEAQIQQENAFSLMNTLHVINSAKFTATPAPDSIDMAVEYIPGTDRVYRQEELILPAQPSAEQVKALARDVMSIKMNMDRISLGKVSQQTKQEIQYLAADVAKALKIYQEGMTASSSSSSSSSSSMEGTVSEYGTTMTMTASPSSTRPSGQESMRIMLDDLGIPLENLNAIPTMLQRQNLFETLIAFNSLRKAMTETILRTEATWVSVLYRFLPPSPSFPSLLPSSPPFFSGILCIISFSCTIPSSVLHCCSGF